MNSSGAQLVPTVEPNASVPWSTQSKAHQMGDFDEIPKDERPDASDGKPYRFVYDHLIDFHMDQLYANLTQPNVEANINWLLVHYWVAVGLSTIVFVIWSIIACTVNQSVPWFIFVPAFFIVSFAVHFYYFVQTRAHLPFHFVVYVCANVVLFICYMFDVFGGGWDSVWFIHVVFGTTLALACHYMHVKHRNDHLLTIVILYLVLNGYTFARLLAFRDIGLFIFTFFGVAVPLLQMVVMQWKPSDRLVAHKIFYASMVLFLFVEWGWANVRRAPGDESDVHLPWFALFAVIWSTVLGTHIYVERRRVRRYNLENGTIQ